MTVVLSRETLDYLRGGWRDARRRVRWARARTAWDAAWMVVFAVAAAVPADRAPNWWRAVWALLAIGWSIRAYGSFRAARHAGVVAATIKEGVVTLEEELSARPTVDVDSREVE